MVGHYGSTAAVAGGVAILLLVVHIAVPYALEDFNKDTNDAGVDDEWLSLKDMDDRLAPLPDQPGLSGLGWVMTGLVLMLIGGLVLTILGFVPLSVNVARSMGWTFGLVGSMGALFALTASLFPVGAGFTTLLGTFGMYPHDAGAARLWIITPVIVAAGSLYMMSMFLRVMTNVVSRENDLRDAARRVLKGPFVAALFLMAVLITPWAVLTENGEERQASGECPANVECKGTITMYTAGGSTSAGNTAGVLSIAEATKDAAGAELFQGVAMGIKVMVAAAWLAFLVGAFASLGHVIGSMTTGTTVVKVFGSFQLLNLITVPWAAVQLALAVAFQTYKVGDSAYLETFAGSFEWWALFFPLVIVAPVLAMLGLRIFENISDIYGDPRTFVEESQSKAISFD